MSALSLMENLSPTLFGKVLHQLNMVSEKKAFINDEVSFYGNIICNIARSSKQMNKFINTKEVAEAVFNSLMEKYPLTVILTIPSMKKVFLENIKTSGFSKAYQSIQDIYKIALNVCNIKPKEISLNPDFSVSTKSKFFLELTNSICIKTAFGKIAFSSINISNRVLQADLLIKLQALFQGIHCSLHKNCSKKILGNEAISVKKNGLREVTPATKRTAALAEIYLMRSTCSNSVSQYNIPNFQNTQSEASFNNIKIDPFDRNFLKITWDLLELQRNGKNPFERQTYFPLEKLPPELFGHVLYQLNTLIKAKKNKSAVSIYIQNLLNIALISKKINALINTQKAVDAIFKSLNNSAIMHLDKEDETLNKKHLNFQARFAAKHDTLLTRKWLWTYIEIHRFKEHYKTIQDIHNIALNVYNVSPITKALKPDFSISTSEKFFLQLGNKPKQETSVDPIGIITPLGKISFLKSDICDCHNSISFYVITNVMGKCLPSNKTFDGNTSESDPKVLSKIWEMLEMDQNGINPITKEKKLA
jgi:hypothetical protein